MTEQQKFERDSKIREFRTLGKSYDQICTELGIPAAYVYAALYPEKAEAQRIFKKAVGSGKLIRPDRCEHCKTNKKRIEGHHPDYSQPLKVIWLCNPCHRAEHERIRNFSMCVIQMFNRQGKTVSKHVPIVSLPHLSGKMTFWRI